jgi:hypothetical protein
MVLNKKEGLAAAVERCLRIAAPGPRLLRTLARKRFYADPPFLILYFCSSPLCGIAV